MGNAVDAVVQQQFVLLDDDEVGRRVSAIGNRLLASAQGRDIPYRFRVINHNDLNAFSGPGGYVYVTYGMLRLAQNEDEVAAVIAHEIAHVAKRHQMKFYRTTQTSQLILNAASIGLSLSQGENAGSWIDQYGPFAALIINNTFSRQQEYEADDGALYLLNQAEYDRHSFVTILRRMYEEKEREKEGEYVPSIFLTHPPTLDRIRRIENKIKSQTPGEKGPEIHVQKTSVESR